MIGFLLFKLDLLLKTRVFLHPEKDVVLVLSVIYINSSLTSHRLKKQTTKDIMVSNTFKSNSHSGKMTVIIYLFCLNS